MNIWRIHFEYPFVTQITSFIHHLFVSSIWKLFRWVSVIEIMYLQMFRKLINFYFLHTNVYFLNIKYYILLILFLVTLSLSNTLTL